MTKKEEFRNFVKSKPELADYVAKNEMTWQKFYELYDLYGEDEKIWQKYQKEERSNPNLTEGISKITNMMKNVDMNSIKNHINTAQKALDLVQDFTTKKSGEVANTLGNLTKGPASPRPLNKFFED